MKHIFFIFSLSLILTSCIATKKDVEFSKLQIQAELNAKQKVAYQELRDELSAKIEEMNQRIVKIEEKLAISKASQENKISLSFSNIEEIKQSIIELNKRIDSIDVTTQKSNVNTNQVKSLEEEVKTLRSQLTAIKESESEKNITEPPVVKKEEKKTEKKKISDDPEKAYRQLVEITKDNEEPAETIREMWENYEKKFPKKHQCDVAFWKAESFYNEKSYNNAIQNYRSIEKDFRKCERLEESYIKIAYSLYYLDKKDLAKKVLEGILEMYPESNFSDDIDDLEKMLKVKKSKKSSNKKEEKGNDKKDKNDKNPKSKKDKKSKNKDN